MAGTGGLSPSQRYRAARALHRARSIPEHLVTDAMITEALNQGVITETDAGIEPTGDTE